MAKKKYEPGTQVEEAMHALESHKQQRPGAYTSQWQDAADGLMHQIQGRDPFTYDAGKDPMYRRMKDQYVRLGRQAMMDTVGKTASLTGGYGNSYGQTAGQQTYQGYLQALFAKLPQFQKMALDQYQAQGRDLMDRYEALSQREKDAYGQYQKILDRYYAKEDRLQDAYDREADRDYHRYTDDRDYDYALERDAQEAARQAEAARREQERWDQDRAYQQDRDRIQDARWEREFEEDRRRYEQEWADKHRPAGGGHGGGHGGSGGNGWDAFLRYQNKHSLSEKDIEKRKESSQAHHHYGKRPNAAPWNPRDSYKRPTFQVTLR